MNYFANKPVTVSTYCLFTPGGNYNTIAGAFTFDSDSNGCSTTDAAAQNVRIGINDGTQTGATITNNQGNYNFYTQNGNFTLTPQFENNWFTATPATATVNFANNNNNTSTQNFCIAPNGVHPDVEVVLVPENGAQPGFDARYKIIYKNKGNQTLSGNVILNYDEAVLDFVSVPSTTPSSAISGQLTWTYSNLLPFESQTINVWLNLNGPMETPSLEIDDILNYTLSITPTTGDETPLDNTFTLKQVITGAFDPNDITCLEGDSVHPNKIGDYLHYNINFENTGNAPATFIVVKDLINAQQYDINTLQMLHASHSVETRINGNKVEFFFDDINLGPLAKGNVVFKIKTQPIVAVNSTVMNKAEIFFDYNWPIVTNQAETTFEVLSAGDFAKDTSVSIYPNPAITSVNIKASTEITSVQLYDVQGRLLQAVPITSNEAVLDVSGRASGIYFVKVMTDKGIKVEKLMRK
ncbi:MAG: T9SS type A sorting domain-containing protein [Flavobacterium sp.]